MAENATPDDRVSGDKTQQGQKSGPSGATDAPEEREQKFDDEGGGQSDSTDESATTRLRRGEGTGDMNMDGDRPGNTEPDDVAAGMDQPMQTPPTSSTHH